MCKDASSQLRAARQTVHGRKREGRPEWAPQAQSTQHAGLRHYQPTAITQTEEQHAGGASTLRRGAQVHVAGRQQQYGGRRSLLQWPGVDRFAILGPRWPWQFNAITGYFSTPLQAASATVSGDAKSEVFVDGTIKAGLGFATSASVARGRVAGCPNCDILGVGNPRYDRPFVSTQAYVTVPRLLGWTTFPTQGYNLAEGRGSTASANQGYMAVGEIAYNPLSNSFGVSVSQAQASAYNYPVVTPGSYRYAGQGFSGLEQVGAANSLTLFTDPRTLQFAQSVAYPFNILTPWNPYTCTQTMINSVVNTWGDLGGPVRDTPRDQPLFLIPFCAEFLNLNAFDNFQLFLQDYLDYYYGYDEAYYHDYGLPGDLQDSATGPVTTQQPARMRRRPGNSNAAATETVAEPGFRGRASSKNSTGVNGSHAEGAASHKNRSACVAQDPSTAFVRGSVVAQAPYPPVPSLQARSERQATQQPQVQQERQQQQQQQLKKKKRGEEPPGGLGPPQLPQQVPQQPLKQPAGHAPVNASGAASPQLPANRSGASGPGQSSSARPAREGPKPLPLPARYAVSGLKQAGFGAGAAPAVLPPLASSALGTDASPPGNKGSTASSGLPTSALPSPTDYSGGGVLSSDGEVVRRADGQQATSRQARDKALLTASARAGNMTADAAAGDPGVVACPARPTKSNVTRGLNLTRPLGPVMLVARPPRQLLPVAWRQSSAPPVQDVTALVALGQSVAQQLQELPLGRLGQGLAATAVGTVANISSAAAPAVQASAREAWNLTNQVARLGAQIALNTFLSSAGAVLPLTRMLYNNSAAWYHAAAGTSQRAVDRAIGDLSQQQGAWGSWADAATRAVQQLVGTAAAAAAEGYTGSRGDGGPST